MEKTKKILFDELDEFQKDFKKLLKKYRTLKDDIEVVKLDLNDEPGASPPFSFRVDNLGLETCIIKVKKMACKALKGKGVNSGLRLIYAHFEEEQKIILVELYHKNDKENEDRQRILENFK
jgi:mRNA-degrading endonuclease YafQ of YafQ-DinJ toxin-antitoxin module